MFTWPENILPLPSHDFRTDVEFSNIRSKMDSGRARQRSRFNGSHDKTNAKFQLTQTEYSYFRGVWVHMINNGNDWFTMRLPLGDGADLTLVEVRFISDLKETHRPVGNWDISAKLEYKAPTVVASDVIDIHAFYGDNTSQFAVEVDQLHNLGPWDWEL